MTPLLPQCRRTMLTAVVAAAGALAIVTAVPGHASVGGQPAVNLDRTEAAVGETVAVSFVGWAAGNTYIEICGNEGARGSVDCDLGSAITSYTAEDGTGHALLKVQAPPIGCPCVVRVSDLTQSVVIATPFVVTGVPVLTPDERPSAATFERKLTVVRAELTGHSGWSALLGASGRRTLVLTLRNSGGGPVTDPSMSLAVGRGAAATTIVDPPAIGRIAAGEEKTLEIPVTLEVPAYGRYTVEGEIVGLDEAVTFTTTTSTYPWGLPVLGLLVIGLVVAWKRVKKRLRGRGVAAGAVGEPAQGSAGRAAGGTALNRFIDLTGKKPKAGRIIDLTDAVSSDD